MINPNHNDRNPMMVPSPSLGRPGAPRMLLGATNMEMPPLGMPIMGMRPMGMPNMGIANIGMPHLGMPLMANIGTNRQMRPPLNNPQGLPIPPMPMQPQMMNIPPPPIQPNHQISFRW
jgi:hypothetical protein